MISVHLLNLSTQKMLLQEIRIDLKSTHIHPKINKNQIMQLTTEKLHKKLHTV